MNCPHCGAGVEDNAGFCSACGQKCSGMARWQLARHAEAPVAYAGFWLRLAAYIIDSILLGFVLGNLLLRPLMGRPGGIPADNPWFIFTKTPRPQVTASECCFS